MEMSASVCLECQSSQSLSPLTLLSVPLWRRRSTSFDSVFYTHYSESCDLWEGAKISSSRFNQGWKPIYTSLLRRWSPAPLPSCVLIGSHSQLSVIVRQAIGRISGARWTVKRSIKFFFFFMILSRTPVRHVSSWWELIDIHRRRTSDGGDAVSSYSSAARLGALVILHLQEP